MALLLFSSAEVWYTLIVKIYYQLRLFIVMKTLTYFSNSCALNSSGIIEAFLTGARQHFKTQENNLNADIAVLWSTLWHGRMKANKTIYNHFRNQGKPVIIIEVGALKRNITWKIAVNHLTAEGNHGHKENLDWDRPKQLGIQLSQQQYNNGKILIAAQHHRSHQLYKLHSQEHWIQQQIDQLRLYTDRQIVVRDHPRSPLDRSKIIGCQFDTANKVADTYDSFDFSYKWHCILNYNSGPGIQSALQGAAVIVDQTSLAYPVSNSISLIEHVSNLATAQWLTEICHTEYTQEEIVQSRWYNRIMCSL